tara:strand:- start:88 stop:303 length:216 start_codon:yes stop_codon:yes gene_type:complete
MEDQCVNTVTKYYKSRINVNIQLNEIQTIPQEIIDNLKLDKDNIDNCIKKSISILKSENIIKLNAKHSSER